MGASRHAVRHGTVEIQALAVDQEGFGDVAAVPRPFEERSPQQPRPSRPRRTTWRRVGLVLGAVAIGAVGLAVWGPDPAPTDTAPPSTPPPTTNTLPAPIATDAALHLVLGAPPAGAQVVDAFVTGSDGGSNVGLRPTLYAGDDATIGRGPWLMIRSVEEPDARIDLGFVTPPASIDVNGTPALLGRGRYADELLAMRKQGFSVEISAHGLPAGTVEAAARRLVISGSGVLLRRSAVPAGMEVVRGENPIEFLDRIGGQPPATGSITYEVGDATVLAAVSRLPVDQITETKRVATVALDGAHDATVRGRSAVVGTRPDLRDSIVVVWTEANRRFVVQGSGLDEATVLALADSLRTSGDGGWDGAAWDQAVAAARQRATTVDADAGPTRRIDGDGSWSVSVALDPATHHAVWEFHDGLGTTSIRSTDTLPAFVVATVRELTASTEPAPWHIGVGAMVDASHGAATLRLTVTDAVSTPLSTEVALHAVEGLDGVIAAGVMLPWTDAYTAELLAADGTVLASASDSTTGS